MELTAVWPVVPMTQLGATKPPIGPVPEGGGAHPVVMPVWFIAGLGIAKPPIGPTPVGAVEWHVSHAAVVGV